MKLPRDLFQPHRLPLAMLFLVGVWLRVANVGNVAVRTPDEHVYTHQAAVWLHSGASGIRSLVDRYEHDPDARNYPTPTRVGVIRLVALTMQLTGRHDETAGAIVSCLASIGSLAVIAFLAARFLPPFGALFALLFYAVSPVELAISRRLWPDAILELLGILLVWIAAEITAGARRMTWLAAFAAAGSVGLAVKESFPVTYGLCGIWVLWVLAVRGRDGKRTLLLAGFCLAGMAAAVAWLAASVGSLSELARIASHVPAANAANTYALAYASGPPWLLLEAFWIVSPAMALFAAAGFFAAFLRSRELEHGSVVAGIAAFTAVHLAIMMAMPHFLNLRYVSMLFGPLYLVAGLGFWWVLRWSARLLAATDRRLATAMAAALVIGLAIGDYLRFERFFVRDNTADLSVRMLQDEKNR